MKLLELNILEFGGLSDRHIVLSEGLNILEGENEAGKSTIWLFIKFMLYGMPRKGHEERERSVSWRSHRAAGSMRVLHKGEEYRIERSFTESGRTGNDKLTIYRHTTGEPVFYGREAGEVFLGVPREVFESTCGIGQSYLSDLGGKKGADAIRNLLSSADENTDISHIEEKLDKIRVQYRHKNGKGGRLYDLGGSINETKKRWERAQDTEKNLVLLEEKMHRNQALAEQTEQKLSVVSERLAQLGTLELLRRFDRLRGEEQRKTELDEAIEALRRREQKTAHTLCESDVATLRSLSENLRAAKARGEVQREQMRRRFEACSYHEADAEVGERLARDGGAERVLSKMKKYSRGAGICFGIGAAFLAAGAVAVIWNWLITVALAVLGGGLLVFSLLQLTKRKAIAKSFGQTAKTLESYLSRCTAASDAKKAELRERTELAAAQSATETLIREMTEQLRGALLRTLPAQDVIPSEDTAEREAARIGTFLREYGALCAQRAAIEASIANESAALSQYEEASLRERLTIDRSELDTMDPVRLETERRFLKTQAQTLSDSLRASQIELISAKANAEDPMVLADRLSALSEEYARAEEYYEALALTMEALSAAGETMSGNITPLLGQRAGEMMEYISAGRYATLSAGADYTPSLLDQSQMTLTAELLSAGTRDVAYLCLRIALVMQLFEGELPPLMLDDALCQVDDKRIVRILTLLSRLGEKDLQCLLFTCHEREARICQELGLPYAKHSLESGK